MIQPPNYTQTPNICFDEIFKTLKEGELRVILVIIRQTFGWHKAYDRISLSQLADKSGILKTSVCRSLNSLIQKGLVQKKIFGKFGQERCYYSLVMQEISEEKIDPNDGIETEEEMELISNNSYQSPKETPQSPKETPPSLLKRPTKETPSKQTCSVSVNTPPVGGPLDEIEKIKKMGMGGQSFEVSKSDLLKASIMMRKNWTPQEIEECWKILSNYSSPISDWFRFCEGTIENLRKTAQTQNIKEKSCKQHQMNQKKTQQNLKEQSTTTKKDISDFVTFGQIYPDFRPIL
ncbi:Bacteriophage lambda, GpO, N-terminal [uncultured Caudovirales phage]|uniref:Bacteriophage lambda, GpO, N-terminal n=1 Tax=uncultured Caudovirales phage TaxID=2100421 RepID=A0A6J5LLH7_9CAUD|nr:Bacteriophage lambda, GpO, N-terminal [uncultured Caudovirales phage]